MSYQIDTFEFNSGLSWYLLRFGIYLSLFSILFGFALGVTFGLYESEIKAYLLRSSQGVFEHCYEADEVRRDMVLKKSWDYFKRAHLHAGAIGTSSIAVIACVIHFTCRIGFLAGISAFCFGAGGLFYGMFWLLAGIGALYLCGTDNAKEYYSIIGIGGASLSVIGLSGFILVFYLYSCKRAGLSN
ncbi:MAG TPA: hypothetical protein PKA63_00645 [Oligoflexia bacterium]|nr:hypothetical protein [Oligoflexia bacterium]HMP47158.1 hypothetical protein [Oligoflexia bacterium]